MCGRYALALPPSRIRRQLQEADMPSQDAPEDDEIRQSYNFAPGYYGLVYRAATGDRGAGSSDPANSDPAAGEPINDQGSQTQKNTSAQPQEPTYKLQKMKWGLIPFWTKRNPDYGSMMKTINCRDDSLASPGGMWTSMKQKKRCIVVAQGFYEWLKKDGGKTKLPHFVKRKDGKLMCMAGLWDCVQYEDATEKLYTYTIITTDSNKQLGFLHDRMPVILENGSEEMFRWLDSGQTEWTKELQSLLKPYSGELDCYPVTQEVGKVGNDSPTFIVPIDSAANKQNIANFFGNQKKEAATKQVSKAAEIQQQDLELSGGKVAETRTENRQTVNALDQENNAPMPMPTGTKRGASSQDDPMSPPAKSQKMAKPKLTPSSARKSKDPTSNAAVSKQSPEHGKGNKKITSFFGK